MPGCLVLAVWCAGVGALRRRDDVLRMRDVASFDAPRGDADDLARDPAGQPGGAAAGGWGGADAWGASDRGPERLNARAAAVADRPNRSGSDGGSELDESMRLARVEALQDRLYHGTTTVAFAFRGGVVCAVDSRASLGMYVGSSATEKVLPVSSSVLATMAGGAADCATWIRLLSARAKLHEMEHGEPLPAAAASQLLARALRGSALRGELSVGTMILGIGRDGEAEMFYVDSDGHRVKGDVFAVGSGAAYAYSCIDAAGDRGSLDADGAFELAERAVRTAAARDAFSGGFVNVFFIDGRTGTWSRVSRGDTAKPSDGVARPHVSRRLGSAR
ncbi:nucleophile aminohydrolase [Pelagophyceae sp. CCMP2097]|nr:nucleophile aminohydrolase [Pelagophyceae sp. CCMP2097]